jgi:large subunit ribosomal protein L6
MSKVAKKPINIPVGMDVVVNNNVLTVKSKEAVLTHFIPKGIEVKIESDKLIVLMDNKIENISALAGTTRALINNVIFGLKEGFERKLLLLGVGYKAAIQGKKLVLNLGFSQPVNYSVPEEVIVEVPVQTEILVKGINKQLVGKVAAEIRAFRPPVPYKGKGVRYSDEIVVQKEGKKK